MPNPDRGEVWLADLDPRRGTEPGKTRPVLIVQSQALMQAEHPSTIVVPLTTTLIDAAEPLRVRLSHHIPEARRPLWCPRREIGDSEAKVREGDL